MLILDNGIKTITNPLNLWGDAETVRSAFEFEGPKGRTYFQLVKQKTPLKALIYRECTKDMLV